MTQNIEIKEIPEMSMIHRTESATYNMVNLKTEGDSKANEGSFMSNPLEQVKVVDKESPSPKDIKQHTFSGKFSNKSKEVRQVNDQTESTMNIKSFSNYGSIRDSVQKENLMSPTVEIQDIDLPHMNDQFVGVSDQMNLVQHNSLGQVDDDYEFEKHYQKNPEDLHQQNENLMFNQSHNSTMLMESVKDNHGSQIWGSVN
jgi:hypothetical protein